MPYSTTFLLLNRQMHKTNSLGLAQSSILISVPSISLVKDNFNTQVCLISTQSGYIIYLRYNDAFVSILQHA